MARISQPKVRGFLSRAQRAATARAKGTIFEDLICYIIEKVPGVSVTRRGILNPYHSEEIDIAIWNEQLATGLRALHHVILIEAKHWSVPAGAPEVNHFVAKLRARKLPLGVFVALNGITGDPQAITAARDAVRQALQDGIHVVVIKRADIENFTSGAAIVRLIKDRICELAASGTQFD
jgi:hypothetical protein